MGEALRKRLRQDRFDHPHHEAMLNLMVAASHLRARIDEVCATHGLTAAQYNVLRILRGAHPAGYPRCEISSRLIERAPDVTRLIDRMERAGLVERARSSEDKRQSITRITRRGLQMLERMQTETDAIHRQLTSRLTRQEALTLSRLCERVYDPEDVTPP